jgi:hypothetical protein
MLMSSVEQLHFCANPHTPALLALRCLSASFLFIVSSVEQLYLCASPHTAAMWGPVSQLVGPFSPCCYCKRTLK